MGDLTSNAEALGDFLKTTRAGVKLPTAFAQMIQATLSDTFEVDTEEGLVNLGAQIVWSAVEQANKGIKPVLGDLFFRWLNDNPSVKSMSSQDFPPNAGKGGGKATDKTGSVPTLSEATTEADSIAGTVSI